MKNSDFFQEYVRLVEALGKGQDPLLWWATDVASKNRFQTKLPALLQGFLATGNRGEPVPAEGLIARGWMIFRISCYCALRAAWARVILGKLPLTRLKPGKTYVAKSFLYDSSFPLQGGYQDPFFGGLIPFLNARSALMVVVDIQGDYGKALKNIRANGAVDLVPWEYFLSWRDIIAAAWRLLRWSSKPVHHAVFFGHDVTDLVNDHLRAGGDRIQTQQFLHYFSVLNLCRSIDVDKILMTFESNPWEKMWILAARRAGSRALVLGYQHNVVPPASANMFIAQGEAGTTPLPDKILTAGAEPRRILGEFGAYPAGMLQTSCALRMGHIFREPFPRAGGRRVLVALEGVDGVRDMVAYVLDQLGRHRDVQVRLRTHPVLPWRYFEERHGFSLKALPQVEVSAGSSLLEDIREADVVLYWGSTVSMEALALGRPVVHFDNKALLSFDPLFSCPHLKWTVGPGDALMPVLESILGLSNDDYTRELVRAREYLKSYFYPVSDEAMALFL